MVILEHYLGISGSVLIDSGVEWPTTAIFSGVHGNEVSGMAATKSFFDEVAKGDVRLERGRVALVLRANQEAAKISERYVKHNLNRLFTKDIADDSSYEYLRSRELMRLLQGVDCLLDLHSTSGPSEPFLFSYRKNLPLTRKFGISRTVVGWNELSSASLAWDTDGYMDSIGKVGFTFEAGNHDSPEGEASAKRVLLNFLVAFGQIDESYFRPDGGHGRAVEITGVHVCESGHFEFRIDSLRSFMGIAKGTLIGLDGIREVRASSDFVLMMPNLGRLAKGEDVFFYGRPA